MRDWAFIFPGQGSQFPGMGHDLWLRFPEFRRDMQQIDTVVRDHRGDGFLDALYGDEWANAVTDLRVSHPAIFSLQYSVSQHTNRRALAVMLPHPLPCGLEASGSQAALSGTDTSPAARRS